MLPKVYGPKVSKIPSPQWPDDIWIKLRNESIVITVESCIHFHWENWEHWSDSKKSFQIEIVNNSKNGQSIWIVLDGRVVRPHHRDLIQWTVCGRFWSSADAHKDRSITNQLSDESIFENRHYRYWQSYFQVRSIFLLQFQSVAHSVHHLERIVESSLKSHYRFLAHIVTDHVVS